MEDASAIPETMIDASEAIAAAGFDVDALVAALEAATGMPEIEVCSFVPPKLLPPRLLRRCAALLYKL